MSVTIGGVELYMGPKSVGGPDDLDLAIRDFIGEAQHSLAIAVQEIDSRPIAEAILEAKRRGVRVRVILEGDYLTEEKALADPWNSKGAHEENRIIQGALLKAKVDVISDLNPKIFHQKFIVRDSGKTQCRSAHRARRTSPSPTPARTRRRASAPARTSTTSSCCTASARRPSTCASSSACASGTFGDLHERVEPKPKEFDLPAVRIKPLFAPRHGPEMEIMKQMLKAKDSIDFAMFTFSQSSGIDDTMIRLRPLVGRIRGVLDRDQGAAKWAATSDLGHGDVQLFANKRKTGVRKLHHKLMVIDERLLIVGSFNYTAPANTLNDENIIVIGDLEEERRRGRGGPARARRPTRSPRSTASSPTCRRRSRSSDRRRAAPALGAVYSSHSVTNVGFAWMCVATYGSGPTTANLCGVNAGTTSTCPPAASNRSSPTVNTARPRRTTKVSAYGCWCNRGPAPGREVYSKISDTGEPIVAPSISSAQSMSSVAVVRALKDAHHVPPPRRVGCPRSRTPPAVECVATIARPPDHRQQGPASTDAPPSTITSGRGIR